jgi:putative Holliday junction resolvase
LRLQNPLKTNKRFKPLTEQLRKTSQKVLAVDHGDSRIGLAVCDELRMFAHPLSTIENKGYAKASAEVLAVAMEQQAAVIVLGLPLQLDGTPGEQAKKVDKFYKKLEAAIAAAGADIRLEVWDERMSSAHAERIIAGTKLKGKARHGAVDRVAAALILEGYLASLRN